MRCDPLPPGVPGQAHSRRAALYHRRKGRPLRCPGEALVALCAGRSDVARKTPWAVDMDVCLFVCLFFRTSRAIHILTSRLIAPIFCISIPRSRWQSLTRSSNTSKTSCRSSPLLVFISNTHNWHPSERYRANRCRQPAVPRSHDVGRRARLICSL